MDHGFGVRQLQRGANDLFARYRLGQPHLPIDGLPGPRTERAVGWALWIVGLTDQQLARGINWKTLSLGGWGPQTLISWEFSPQRYFARHPGGYRRHRARLAQVRARHDPAPGFVWPFAGAVAERRTDRGQDVQTSPGSGILAVCSGEVTATPSTGSAVGSYGQIVVRSDRTIGGFRHFYAFHLDNCHVRTGERIGAGHLLATSSWNPPGADGMPGWCEYGCALDSSGDIDQDVGPDHYAPSGQAMHDLLHRLRPDTIGQPAIRA